MAKFNTIMFEMPKKLYANELIEKLTDQRREFNNNRGAGQVNNLPTPEYIFNREKLTTITFEGLDFIIKDRRVIGIKGLTLSEKALQQITDKLLFLDKVQFDYCEKSNREYLSGNADLQNIRNIDRWFFTSLKILTTTLNDIAAFTKKANTTVMVEANLANMRKPNIDTFGEKPVDQAIVQLAK
ncbi:hypothetical protein ACS5PU_11910 [Pedobacter sp. GSP4]|uniref:hypothetical protein n=1 Tax=Pedobacter sp. GSP4 TaxID=3453716 RepID=UPI003EEDB17B